MFSAGSGCTSHMVMPESPVCQRARQSCVAQGTGRGPEHTAVERSSIGGTGVCVHEYTISPSSGDAPHHCTAFREPVNCLGRNAEMRTANRNNMSCGRQATRVAEGFAGVVSKAAARLTRSTTWFRRVGRGQAEGAGISSRSTVGRVECATAGRQGRRLRADVEIGRVSSVAGGASKMGTAVRRADGVSQRWRPFCRNCSERHAFETRPTASTQPIRGGSVRGGPSPRAATGQSGGRRRPSTSDSATRPPGCRARAQSSPPVHVTNGRIPLFADGSFATPGPANFGRSAIAARGSTCSTHTDDQTANQASTIIAKVTSGLATRYATPPVAGTGRTSHSRRKQLVQATYGRTSTDLARLWSAAGPGHDQLTGRQAYWATARPASGISWFRRCGAPGMGSLQGVHGRAGVSRHAHPAVRQSDAAPAT